MTADISTEFPARKWGVRVHIGPVPENLEDVTRDEGFLQMSAEAFLVKVDQLGRMLVTRDEVVVAPDQGIDVSSMDYLIYGWAPRFVRILRREFTVHASAVQFPTGAAGIMGPAMVGKSTTVMGLARRGFPLIIDDILPVDFIDGVPTVHGWERPLHLRDQAADHFSVSRARVLTTAAETKVQFTTPTRSEATPLRLLVELMPDPRTESVAISRLHGADALRACIRSTNASGIAAADGRAERSSVG